MSVDRTRSTSSLVEGHEHTPSDELEVIMQGASGAARLIGTTSPLTRGGWLHAVADAVDSQAGELVPLADEETGLGSTRLTNEIARATAQIRFYADVATEGSYLAAAIDRNDAKDPAPARTNVPLGPVAVFGASNVPFAFSVFGNDTAAAIAAGCSVVVKAHLAHPLLSTRVFEIAQAALLAAGAPHGTLQMISGHDAGLALGAHPLTSAVVFTGSQSGGLALWRHANERDVVIPVFAEMGTVNPVIVTPSGTQNMHELARGFVESFTLGSGQFCTKPGLMLAPSGSDAIAHVARALDEADVWPVMVTSDIAASVTAGVEELCEAGATISYRSAASSHGRDAPAVLLSAPISTLRAGSRVLEECFGAVPVVVEYDTPAAVVPAIETLQGDLAASLWMAEGDPDVQPILDALERRVGRVVVNDWPTGVACTWPQHHGGAWPATSNASATSVGAAAIDRFVRPVAYQGVPDHMLPPPVQAVNPWRVPQRINGVQIIPSTS